MKKISYETYLGILMLTGILLLSTKGVEKARVSTSGEAKQSTESTEAIGAENEKGDAKAVLLRTVVLDAGHGGTDPGKIGINNALEKDINLAIAEKLKTCLEKQGIYVVMTRETEEGLYREGDSNKKQADMRARCEIIDSASADLTVSIHQNSYTSESVCGPQVFYHAQSAEGEKAAACLQEALNEGLSIERPREIKANNTYYILKKTTTPVVIAECGFLSNQAEADKLITEDYQQKVAEALCAGILSYLDEKDET